MRLRTKDEQKAYLDGFKACAKCIESYLSGYGKKKLACFLTAVQNAVENEDVAVSEDKNDKTKTLSFLWK